jgi:cytochrome P450
VLPALARDPLSTCLRARNRYGDVVRLPVLNGSVYLLTHPDHVEHVLVTRNANHWKGRLFGRADFLLGNGLVLNEGESWNRQMQLVVSALSREFRPRTVGDRPVRARAQSTLRSQAGIPMVLERLPH